MQNERLNVSYGSLESVDNALKILLLFRDRDALRVTDASVELGVSRSTAHRLIRTLANRGFVQQERDSRSYRAGPALMEFALSSPSAQKIRTAAHPYLVDLSRELNETVNVLVMERDGVRFVDSVECDRPVRVTARTGVILPSHATAGGKVLLAAMNSEDSTPLLSSGLRRITMETITSRKALSEELEEVRRLGYATNRGESMDDLHAVAVCIADHRGQALASLAVSVPADRGGLRRLRKFIPELRRSADRIGQQLRK